MVMSASDAADKYETGIRAIGISSWKSAAGKSTPKAAAELLEDAKEEAISVSTFKTKYKAAYS